MQFKRLHLIANHVRFLILPDWHLPNLASHLLAMNLKRLSLDWQHCPLAGHAVAVDGKILRGGHDAGKRPPHLISAILHQQAVVIAQVAVEEKTNEIHY